MASVMGKRRSTAGDGGVQSAIEKGPSWPRHANGHWEEPIAEKK